MADLVKEFFERDLTEAEHEAMARLLEQSPEAALDYERRLEQYYLATGLPQPTLPQSLRYLPKTGGGGWISGSGWIKLMALGLAMGGALWKFWPATKVEIPVTVHPQAARQVPVEPALRSVRPEAGRPLPFHPAAGGLQEGKELSVVLDAPRKSLVTVRILDDRDKEVRDLYTGFVQPGRWAFRWDGLLENGEPADAGRYRIDVQSGATHLTKNIQIKHEPASN